MTPRLAPLLLILAVNLVAAPSARAERPIPPTLADPRFLDGVEARLAGAQVDSFVLLGGEGSLEGRFQDAAGQPHWHGWTHEDATGGDPHWHVSEFMAVVGQLSLWCGRYYGDDPGYGNGWNESVVFRHAVADPGASSTVRWQAMLRNDTEPDWDFTHLEVDRGGSWTALASVSGDTLLVFDEILTLTPDEYAGPAGDEIRLRVRFVSDGGWSDADGLWDTDGACQLDEVAVTVDGVQVDAEDFEDGTSDRWQPEVLAVGDFAALYTGLQELDPCLQNASPQLAFVDDGMVVPGTGGAPCITWCYGPDGYIVNNTGGLSGPQAHLLNRVMSPALTWPEGADALSIEFTVYRHQLLGNSYTWPLILYQVLVRSTADPVAAPLEDQPWLSPDNTFYYGGPNYRRQTVDASADLVPGRELVQVALQVGDFGYMLGYHGVDGTPAPYFDDVRVVAFAHGGPLIDINIDATAQDGFPEIGILDTADLSRNHIRFDSARNVAASGDPTVDFGDSLVVTVVPVRAGSTIPEPPTMHVRLRANPLFDGVRQQPPGFVRHGAQLVGTVEGRPVDRRGRDPDEAARFCFDLPDTGFFFPGDVIHYAFEARDELAGDVGVSLQPADTTGFADFDLRSSYPMGREVRGLPSLHSAEHGDQPSVLFWNDAGSGNATWSLSFSQLGHARGVDYDLFVTRAPSNIWPTGLGSRATSAVLGGYEVLVYDAGTAAGFTLRDEDAALLMSWFARGGRHALLAGDGLVTDLQYGSAAVLAFAGTYVGAHYHGAELRDLIGGQAAPEVRPLPDNGFVTMVDRWVAHGGCPRLRSFDAIDPAEGSQAIAQFLNPDGNGGVYPYAAGISRHVAADDATVVLLPYSLTAIRNAPDWTPPPDRQGIAARALVLEDVLAAFGSLGGSPPVTASASPVLAVRAAPNPFNPRVTFTVTVPAPGTLSMRLYDLRGLLVRTLIEDAVAAGSRTVSWDGRAGNGRAAASGLYFCEVRLGQDVAIERVTLLR